VDQWIDRARQQLDGASPGERKERLALAMGVEWPAKVASAEAAGELRLSREGRGDLVTGIVKGKPVGIAVHPDGAAKANGDHAILLNVFRTRSQASKHFTAFNRADDANRVQDIVTAIAYLKQQGVNKPKLKCSGRAAVWCTFAAAVSETPVDLEAPLGSFRGTDQDMIEQFFIPGLQRAGGLAAAMSLLR
jgi:hypothetical protein